MDCKRSLSSGRIHRIHRYDQAIELNPDFYQAWTNKGYALGRLKRYKESLDSCQKAIQINKNDVFAGNCQGIMLENFGKYEQAIKEQAIVAFDTAIKINPNYLFAYNNKARSLSKLKRYDEALAAFDKAIQIRPDYQPAIEGRKQTLKQLGG